MARRPRRWACFSINEISEAVGRHPKSVQVDARRGLVDRKDVRSVARYVVGLAPVSAVAREAYLRLGVSLGLGDEAGRPFMTPTGERAGGLRRATGTRCLTCGNASSRKFKVMLAGIALWAGSLIWLADENSQ